MSLLFWRKTRDLSDDNSRAVAITEDTPLPVSPSLGDEDAALKIIIESTPLEVYYPIDYEAVTVAATAIGLTPSRYQNADRAFMTLETAQIRFRYDGASAPTATTGHVLDPAGSLTVDGPDALRTFQAIRTGGTSGTLTVTYERRRQ